MARLFTDEGKPYLDVYLSTDSVFVNSKNIFIEYHDTLFAHGFGLLLCIYHTNWDIAPHIFDYSIFDGMEPEDLYEWYTNRKHQNFFFDIPVRGTFDTEAHRKESLDNIYWDLMSIPETYYYSCKYSLIQVIDRLLKTNASMTKKIYIYGGMKQSNELEASVRDLWKRGKEKLVFVYGSFEESLTEVNKDCTYFLSDMEKLDILEATDRIRCASVLIPNGWRYNYNETDRSLLKRDPEALMKKYPSHIEFFINDMI